MDEDADTYRRKKLVEVFDWHGGKKGGVMLDRIGVSYRRISLFQLPAFVWCFWPVYVNFECIS